MSNLDKVLYPATGFTKGEMLHYYIQISPVLLKHLDTRPLTMKRYPDGVDAPSFYEKRCPPYRPSWVCTLTKHNPRQTKHVPYCVVDHPASLVWVANLASIELHVLLAPAEHLDQPKMVVFDLDPGAPAGLLDCVRLAQRLRQVLHGVKLEAFVKTSGGKGLHVAVPLNTRVTYDQTKPFARAVAELLERDQPDRVTSSMAKRLRPGKVFVDWSQNVEHKTTVCAYSLRARERPSVSTPVRWEELDAALRRGKPEALAFGPDEVLARVRRMGDLFKPVLTLKQRLPPAL